MTGRSVPWLSRMGGALMTLVVTTVVVAQQPPPLSPNPEEALAKKAFNAGKLDEALQHLQAVSKANPTFGPPKVVASRWYLETGQGEQARLLLEQAASEDPNHPDVLLTNAMYALREGRLTDTILSCSAALSAAENPRWDAEAKKRYQREARLGRAAALEIRGDFASMKADLLALLEGDAKNSQLRVRLARANFLLNRPEDAFTDLQRAFADDPTLDPPELGMAQLWTSKQDFAKADDWYGKAIAAHPKSAAVHRAFTAYLVDRGRIDTAKTHLAAAQQLDPTSLDTKALGGLVARYAKDYPTAATIFEELIKTNPTYRNGFASANLALVLAESGDTKAKQRAVEFANVYAQQNPRIAEARAILAYTLYKSGRAADAEKAMREAVALGPLLPDGAYFVAVILADRGQYEDAYRVVKASLENTAGSAYRKEAETLRAELEKKLPPPKK
jgi:Tfp pilus assembly protein PilF